MAADSGVRRPQPDDLNGFLSAPIGNFFDESGHVVNDPYGMNSFTNDNALPVWNPDKGMYEFPGMPSASDSGFAPGGFGIPGGAGDAAAPIAKTAAASTGIPDIVKLIAQIGGGALASAFAPPSFQPKQSFKGTAADPIALLSGGEKNLSGLISGLLAKIGAPTTLPGATVQNTGLPSGYAHDPLAGSTPSSPGLDLSSLGIVPPPTATPAGGPARLPFAGAMSGSTSAAGAGVAPTALDPKALAAIQLFQHAASAGAGGRG